MRTRIRRLSRNRRCGKPSSASGSVRMCCATLSQLLEQGAARPQPHRHHRSLHRGFPGANRQDHRPAGSSDQTGTGPGPGGTGKAQAWPSEKTSPDRLERRHAGQTRIGQHCPATRRSLSAAVPAVAPSIPADARHRDLPDRHHGRTCRSMRSVRQTQSRRDLL